MFSRRYTRMEIAYYDENKSLKIDDEEDKPLLGEVNAVLLDLDLAGKHDAKPTHEELKDWIYTCQVDVLNRCSQISLSNYHLLENILSRRKNKR